MNTLAVEANVAPPAGLLVTKMLPPRLRGAASSRRRLAYLYTDPAALVVVTAAAGFGTSTAEESSKAIVREARPLG